MKTKEKNMDATGKSFVNHWKWAASKGVMNRNTAGALHAASSQVIAVLDDWENLDVTTIDPDEVVKRFNHLRAKDFKPESLDVYGKRFKSALTSYLAYVRDPGAWRPTKQSRPARPERNGNEANNEQEGTPSRTEFPKPGLVDYPFPLRDGLTARLMLPRDLKVAEVKRLNAFMTTLAVDSVTE